MNNTLKEKIIQEWSKTKIVHPSYREIAKALAKKKIKVTHGYCFQVIKEHQKENEKWI